MARDQYRVVGVIVTPMSKDTHLDSQGYVDCDTTVAKTISSNADTDILYTYDVQWRVCIFLCSVDGSIRVRNGLRGGTSIFIFRIRRSTGLVSLIPPSSSSFLPEW